MVETVKKVWGNELWVCNTDLYCGKILYLKKDFHCSYHMHSKKDEHFFVRKGKVLMEIEERCLILKEGEAVHVPNNTYHRFTGLRDSEIIEFSTHHEDSDTIRLSKSAKVKTIIVDIDGFLCTDEQGQYKKCKPKKRNIQKVNDSYDEGNHIIIWTARGTTTGQDWEILTENQLKNWGVKYHELRFEKPYYDEWWDDKAVLK
jgi:mannose-6-phosphate isomerase-like protein (cupin superfamily)